MSDDRRHALYEEQIAFCDMHPEIIKELKKRGVVMKQKFRRPAREEFSKEIQYHSEFSNNGETEETREDILPGEGQRKMTFDNE